MEIEIRRGASQSFRLVFRVAQHAIAAVAQQPPYFSRSVAVVYVQDVFKLCRLFTGAYRAHVVLVAEQSLVLRQPDSIFAQQMPFSCFCFRLLVADFFIVWSCFAPSALRGFDALFAHGAAVLSVFTPRKSRSRLSLGALRATFHRNSYSRIALAIISGIWGTTAFPRARSFWTRFGTPVATRPANRTSPSGSPSTN